VSLFTPLADIYLAGAEEARERAARLGNAPTAGPPVAPGPPPQPAPHPPWPRWVDGWWVGARRMPAHPGRVGGAIRAFCAGVHSTDMLPEEWEALIENWTKRAGEGAAKGACANFVIGRDESQGPVQLVPINRNGNHMGGEGHGVFRVGGDRGVDLHPNLCAVGIEVHCAGGVVKLGGVWRFVEGKVAHGKPIPDSDVIPDPHRPGRGWHVVTPYQYRVLDELLGDLDQVLAPVPSGCVKVAFGEAPPAYAVLPGCRIATHAELDPEHRADPWGPTCDWLRARIARRLAG
jgi:hypothetical protein